jgi:Phage integrase, N-terminal SAM-like domain
LLRTAILGQGIALESVDDLDGALGTSSGGCIRLLNGLSPATEFTTLAHEYAHLCTGSDYVRSFLVTGPHCVDSTNPPHISVGDTADFPAFKGGGPIMFHEQRRRFRPAVARRTVNDAVRPAISVRGGVSGDDALDDLIRALRDERGLAAATLVALRRSLTPFLAWLAARGRACQDAALEDVTAYLASRPTGAA